MLRLRAEFVLQGTLLGHALNGPMLRGSLGYALRNLCGRSGLYRSLFEQLDASAPRPFRIRSPLGEPGLLRKGTVLPFDLDLFGDAAGESSLLCRALVVMGHVGFGSARTQAKLCALRQELPNGSSRVAIRGSGLRPSCQPFVLADYLALPLHGVRFVSPVRLASRGPARAPSMDAVLDATRRRIASLSGLDVDPPDGPAVGEWQHVRTVHEQRYSRREGVQPMSGIMGEWHPTQELGLSSLLLLSAACVLGVGRHTSMGMGDCRRI